MQRWIQGGRGGGGRAPLFLRSLIIIIIICNYFEELQTVLFEVELIINYEPLTYL